MTSLGIIVKALEASWEADTAYDAGEWATSNPARGQCVVSSLVVQDYLGGELLRYAVEGNDIRETHYFNQLKDGTIIDTTGKQYRSPVNLRLKPIAFDGFSSIREKRLSDDSTRIRYNLLKDRVDSYLLQDKS